MPRKQKLNSMRVLDGAKAAYEVLNFPDTVHSAEGVAEALGIPPAQVFKTLVVERVGGGKPLLVMVAAEKELDLKSLAVHLGCELLILCTSSLGVVLASQKEVVSFGALCSDWPGRGLI